MSRARTRSLLLAVTLTGPACPLTPEIVGATITSTTSPGTDEAGDVGSSASATDGSGATDVGSGTSATSAGPVDGAYGSFCELVGVGADIQSTAITPQPLCDGGICVLVSDVEHVLCDDDPTCDAQAEGSVCGENGTCNLTPTFLEQNTRCTRTCAADDECPEIFGCETGSICSAITVVDELCCQKVCVCNDHIIPVVANYIQSLCDNEADPCA